MPVARKYPNNAARQKAYRERQAAKLAARGHTKVDPNQEIVRRVMASEAQVGQK